MDGVLIREVSLYVVVGVLVIEAFGHLDFNIERFHYLYSGGDCTVVEIVHSTENNGGLFIINGIIHN